MNPVPSNIHEQTYNVFPVSSPRFPSIVYANFLCIYDSSSRYLTHMAFDITRPHLPLSTIIQPFPFFYVKYNLCQCIPFRNSKCILSGPQQWLSVKVMMISPCCSWGPPHMVVYVRIRRVGIPTGRPAGCSHGHDSSCSIHACKAPSH